MTPALLIARGLIIHWATLWLAPVEYAFDMIESALERRGVDLQELVVAGSLWIMTDLNENMTMSPELMNLHMQR